MKILINKNDNQNQKISANRGFESDCSVFNMTADEYLQRLLNDTTDDRITCTLTWEDVFGEKE